MRWKVVAIAAISSAILVAVGGLAWFEYWRRGSPEYSISQIAVAVDTHDLQLFRKHVDVRSVTSRLIDDLNSRDGHKENVFGAELVGLIKPQLVAQMSDQMERFVETGKFENGNQADSALPMLHEEFQGRFGTPSTKRHDGNVAVVDLPVTPRNNKERTVILELRMRPTGDGYWQLMEVSLPKQADVKR